MVRGLEYEEMTANVNSSKIGGAIEDSEDNEQDFPNEFREFINHCLIYTQYYNLRFQEI